MIKDGLWDAFHGYHMGNTAENVAAEVPDHPRGAGRLRRRLAEQGRGGAEGRPLQGRDRPGHGQDAARATSSSTPTSTRATARPSRRCRSCARPSARTARSPPATPRGINDGAAALVLMTRRGGQEARHQAAGPDRLLGDRRRRSGDHGHRPGPGLARRCRRPAGRSTTSTWSRPTRPSRRRPSRSTRSSASIPTRSTSMAAPSRSAIRSAPRARAC